MESEVLNSATNHANTIHSLKDLFLTMNEWGIIPITMFFVLVFFVLDYIRDKRLDKINDKFTEVVRESNRVNLHLREAIKEQTDFFKDDIKKQESNHREIINLLDEIKQNQLLIITDKICKKFGKGRENGEI